MRYPRQILVATVAVLSAVVLVGSMAGASVSIPQNPIPVSSGAPTVTVNVSYSFGAGGALKPLFFHQCRKDPNDPTFNFAADCSGLSQIQVNGTSNPTGDGSLAYELFRGDEPSGDANWGCYAAGDTPSAGYTKLTTCWIRVTTDSPSNNAQAQSIPFTFTVQGAPVPEAPTLILLPFIAAGVIAAGYVLNRRRTARASLV